MGAGCCGDLPQPPTKPEPPSARQLGNPLRGAPEPFPQHQQRRFSEPIVMLLLPDEDADTGDAGAHSVPRSMRDNTPHASASSFHSGAVATPDGSPLLFSGASAPRNDGEDGPLFAGAGAFARASPLSSHISAHAGSPEDDFTGDRSPVAAEPGDTANVAPP